MDELLERHEELRKAKDSNQNIACVDQIISLLTQARNQIAADPQRASETVQDVQEPVSKALSSLRKQIKTTTRLHDQYSKELDKFFTGKDVPNIHSRDELFSQKKDLLNKAIAMHCLREGQFEVADTFVREQQEVAERRLVEKRQHQQQQQQHDGAGEASVPSPTTGAADGDIELTDAPVPDPAPPSEELVDQPCQPDGSSENTPTAPKQSAVPSDDMREDFVRMYNILEEIRKHNLIPAIRWADRHKKVLEKKGSDLAFQLCKLQYLWLFQGRDAVAGRQGAGSGSPADDGRSKMQWSIAAIQFARQNFSHYFKLHEQEIKQLVGALPFATNLTTSPYAQQFNHTSLWDEATQSFTREYCSVLGIAAESPLYIAATAGILSLSTFQKTQAVMSKTAIDRGADKLISDVPLPRQFRFHPVFICPVMKDATTPENPPALLPCGHVLSLQATELLGKGGNFKCPYCPKDCNPNLIKKLII
ncbi:hypothetical protein KEM52_006450 [Ascosphaera acerosa]|nr:hypothetical protein KEM52_006450 [Ascosphaera acerosa]